MVAAQGYTLWGSANSLYTGKLRSYLIKKGLPYRERYPSDPDFAARVLPVVGHFAIPVLETPDGAILRASAPHGLWHFAKAADFARTLDGADRQRLDTVLDRTGGQAMMAIRPSRPIARADNVLVLA